MSVDDEDSEYLPATASDILHCCQESYARVEGMKTWTCQLRVQSIDTIEQHRSWYRKALQVLLADELSVNQTKFITKLISAIAERVSTRSFAVIKTAEDLQACTKLRTEQCLSSC